MRKFMKRIVGGKKGMEALQAVLLLGAAFFVIMALKTSSTNAITKAEGHYTDVLNPSSGGAAAQTK